MDNKKAVIQKQPHREKCELALGERRCLEDSDCFALLLDDEELELQELQAGPNPLSCCMHFTSNGLRGCSLCQGDIGVACLIPFSLKLFIDSF